MSEPPLNWAWLQIPVWQPGMHILVIHEPWRRISAICSSLCSGAHVPPCRTVVKPRRAVWAQMSCHIERTGAMNSADEWLSTCWLWASGKSWIFKRKGNGTLTSAHSFEGLCYSTSFYLLLRLKLEGVVGTSKADISPKLYVSRGKKKKQQQKGCNLFKKRKAESKNIKVYNTNKQTSKQKLKKASECLLQECREMSRWMEKKRRKLWKLRKGKHYSYKSPVVIFCAGINKFQSSKIISLIRFSQKTNPLLMLI